jgi:hypothetical protein
MLNTAAKLRVQSAWDVETTSTVVALRTLARRAHAMQQQARELQKEVHVGHGAQRVTLRRRRLARPRHLYRRPGPRRFRLVVVAVRILVDKQDPRDIAEVAPLQDALGSRQPTSSLMCPSPTTRSAWIPPAQRCCLLTDGVSDCNGTFGPRPGDVRYGRLQACTSRVAA